MMKTNLVALSITVSLAVHAEEASARLKTIETSTDTKTGLVWVKLPGGEFHYGCEPQDADCFPKERPGRKVRVEAFFMMQTEVTIGAYDRCRAARVCPGGSSGDSYHPVTEVNWYDATIFCLWVGGRLPTAEEWEYAAKSGGSRIYPWGDEQPDGTRANCGEKCGDSYSKTSPVGSFPAGDTPWGLKDMAGNVWEWTSSPYDSGKAVRGGGWEAPPQLMRTSLFAKEDSAKRFEIVGFRCAQ